MAKPGLKIKHEQKYSLAATGKVVIQDDKVLIDVSEEQDNSQLEDINKYLKDLSGLMVDVKIIQKEVDEEE